eukprot:TRINITY_DN30464_c0_g1_i1.p1 TRINITY_DN30464_c0_g1~~TRINITY_DN30464_c0_g1_i1.p1  ORF type:complete len:237 (+),score=56.22 TRINITY_DN30464_c0_g1_i1:33-713(+)
MALASSLGPPSQSGNADAPVQSSSMNSTGRRRSSLTGVAGLTETKEKEVWEADPDPRDEEDMATMLANLGGQKNRAARKKLTEACKAEENKSKPPLHWRQPCAKAHIFSKAGSLPVNYLKASEAASAPRPAKCYGPRDFVPFLDTHVLPRYFSKAPCMNSESPRLLASAGAKLAQQEGPLFVDRSDQRKPWLLGNSTPREIESSRPLLLERRHLAAVEAAAPKTAR